MPVARSTARTLARPLATAALALVTLLAVAPGRASALEPPRPLPGHRAEFVTETDERPWRDCLWASAAMLLDKWTNGDVQVSHQRLRKLSGDRSGGSSLVDLRAAFRRLGFKVDLDAGGDATMTWGALLRRLKDGGGAVVLGDYGQLPRWFGRWDARFWKGKGTSGNDNHAVYVERYDPRRGVVWLMDPLARGDHAGEWLPIRSLQRYAWFKSGRVQAVATPAARPAPFAHVRVGDGAVAASRDAVTASWDLHAPRKWRFTGADVRAFIDQEADPIEAAARNAVIGRRTSDDAAPSGPRASLANRRTLLATAALPDEPGAWTTGLRLTDRRFGNIVARSVPVTAFVPGPRSANLRLDGGNADPIAGSRVTVDLVVANTGDEAWAAVERFEATERDRRPEPTRVVATWIRMDEASAVDPRADAKASAPGGRAEPGRFKVELRRLVLDPGRTTRFDTELRVPTTPGRWALVIDLENEVDGSFARMGSEPAVALYDVQLQASPLEDIPTVD